MNDQNNVVQERRLLVEGFRLTELQEGFLLECSCFLLTANTVGGFSALLESVSPSGSLPPGLSLRVLIRDVYLGSEPNFGVAADANLLILMFLGIAFENMRLVSWKLLAHIVEIYILDSVFTLARKIPGFV